MLTDTYRVDAPLGGGRTGVVVAATHLPSGRHVAIKILHAERAADPEAMNAFLQEARFAAMLEGAHSVQVIDVATTAEALPFIVMEHLEGLDLARLVAQRGLLPARDAAGYVIEACDAVTEAHGLGIVHNDLRPSHLFLSKRGIIVLDFGRASMPGNPRVDVWCFFGVLKALVGLDDPTLVPVMMRCIGNHESFANVAELAQALRPFAI